VLETVCEIGYGRTGSRIAFSCACLYCSYVHITFAVCWLVCCVGCHPSHPGPEAGSQTGGGGGEPAEFALYVCWSPPLPSSICHWFSRIVSYRLACMASHGMAVQCMLSLCINWRWTGPDKACFHWVGTGVVLGLGNDDMICCSLSRMYVYIHVLDGCVR